MTQRVTEHEGSYTHLRKESYMRDWQLIFEQEKQRNKREENGRLRKIAKASASMMSRMMHYQSTQKREKEN